MSYITNADKLRNGITKIIPTAVEEGNWNAAYGWGDHALAGYLTMETDPVFGLWLAVPPNISIFGNDVPYLSAETDPVFGAWLAVPPNISIFNNDSGFLSAETDPVFGAWLAVPPGVSIFGNDSGYLTAETDPVFTAWDKDYADLINTPAIPGAYTDEMAQDAIGGILDNGTIGNVVFTYDDGTPKISANISYNNKYDNSLINSNFDIWQEGTSAIDLSAIPTYRTDQWKSYYGGSVGTLAGTQGRSSFTLGQTAVPNNPLFYLDLVISDAGTIGNNAYCVFEQPMEDVNLFSGMPVALSFWAKASLGTPIIATSIVQRFGDSGSPSTTVNTALGRFTLSTSWQKFTATVTVPSVSGKTTTTNPYLSLMIWLASGSDYNAITGGAITPILATYSFSQFKLENGSVVTPYQPRHIQVENMLCQRFLTVSQDPISPLSTAIPFIVSAFSNLGFPTSRESAIIALPVKMRKIPTITLWDNAGTPVINQVYWGQYGISLASLPSVGSYITPTYFIITSVQPSGVYYDEINCHWKADARY